MTGIDTAAIEARLAAATPGPWVRRHGNVEHYFPHIGEYGDICTPDDANADLIANAPTDLRALLDEVERLRATIAAVAALAEEWSTATCQTDGAPCSWHRVSADCAAELREALDGAR